MKEIKFILKDNQQYYKAKDRGLYENVFVVPISHFSSNETKVTKIDFKGCYLDDVGEPVTLFKSSKIFNKFNTDTIVNIGTEAEPIEQEVTSAIAEGFVYSLDKVIRWGDPDWIRCQGYYSIGPDGKYKFPDDPQKAQLAKDYIIQATKDDQGIPLVENFEYEEIEE